MPIGRPSSLLGILALACASLVACSGSDSPAPGGSAGADGGNTTTDDDAAVGLMDLTPDEVCALVDENDIAAELGAANLMKTDRGTEPECGYQIGKNGAWFLLHVYNRPLLSLFPAQSPPGFEGIADVAYSKGSGSVVMARKGQRAYFVQEHEPANLTFLKAEATKVGAQL